MYITFFFSFTFFFSAVAKNKMVQLSVVQCQMSLTKIKSGSKKSHTKRSRLQDRYRRTEVWSLQDLNLVDGRDPDVVNKPFKSAKFLVHAAFAVYKQVQECKHTNKSNADYQNCYQTIRMYLQVFNTRLYLYSTFLQLYNCTCSRSCLGEQHKHMKNLHYIFYNVDCKCFPYIYCRLKWKEIPPDWLGFKL